MSAYLSSQNSFQYPYDFTNAYWTKANTFVASADILMAPNGSMTADLIMENVASGQHILYRANGCGVDAVGERLVQEVYVHEFSADRGFDMRNGSNALFGAQPRAQFWPSSGGTVNNIGVGSSAYAQDVGSGWYKCTLITPPAIATGVSNAIVGYFLNAAGLISYVGNSMSGLYFWEPSLRKMVDVEPEYDFKRGGAKIEDVHRTRSGSMLRYKKGEYSRVSFGVKHLSSAQATTINSWWLAGHPVQFYDVNNYCVASGYLVNKEQPVGKLSRPYTDAFMGIIELETY